MKESDGTREVRRSSGHSNEPAIQVICLGAGGGPTEDNVTGFLVRSVATKWSKNSVLAVDAGSHLAAITRILEKHFPLVSEPRPTSSYKVDSIHGGGVRPLDDKTSPKNEHHNIFDNDSGADTPLSEDDMPLEITTLLDGVFAGLPFPNASARANALHIVREHVSTYLITHPHLDHLSGFVVNTAAFHNTSRPKRLAALPFTVHAIKTHVFNNIIWPNLTDEDGGVGLVSFQRLAEGGNIALGQGKGRGYIEVCDGLGVKGFKVSHGHCMQGPGHVHRGSNAEMQEVSGTQHTSAAMHQSENREGRSHSFSVPLSQPGTPGLGSFNIDQGRRSSGNNIPADHCVVDSSAFFIRAESTMTTPTREILVFGDVEPDSLSLSPRTAFIWAEAAPKIAVGILTGIFIECSYTDAQADAVLFGHLAPRHLLSELQNLADMVKDARKEHDQAREVARQGRKRKRLSRDLLEDSTKSRSWHSRMRGSETPLSGVCGQSHTEDDRMTDFTNTPTGMHTPDFHTVASKNEGPAHDLHASHPSAPAALNLNSISAEHNRAMLSAAFEAPLRGLKVIVIHVKDTCEDGPLVGDTILRQLCEGEAKMKEDGRALGCTFQISKSGDAYWF
ncbi:3',5'-cyclic-nucleotide phosphodiesterase pde1 [Curvularia kusanoi]|uniref:3',5'-cyclic-nucleotide phosphodiesterase pde1 n=1 Tax=Curvularia kusanoi TaxID=90978 RepID=A0A9P4W436_CURKU|nr:3',5'-cyclic-nucleotide phosphodiesterase pde1 [Curvularia kusanoi]